MADEAISLFDMNADGRLSVDELLAAPGLLAGFARNDADKDEVLSADEIAARLAYYKRMRDGVKGGYSCRVLYNGRPIENAKVRFVPEAFLADVTEPATGVSKSGGGVHLTIEGYDVPDDLKSLSMIRIGMYRVEVTHDTIVIPPQYNSATELGVEVSPNSDPSVVFDLVQD